MKKLIALFLILISLFVIAGWNRESEDNIMHFLPDSKIAIKWDSYEDQEPFREEWATKYPDKNAFIAKYCIYYEEEIIKVFGIVYVDGNRALLPIPKLYSYYRKKSYAGCN